MAATRCATCDQQRLFGAVASDATAWRVVEGVCEHGLLGAIAVARATARARAFALGAQPAGPLVIVRAGHAHGRGVRRLGDDHAQAEANYADAVVAASRWPWGAPLEHASPSGEN